MTQLVLVVLGLVFVFDPGDLGGTRPGFEDVAFALALATLAYTGLETVANYASETREPGRSLPRSLFGALAAVVAVAFLLGPGRRLGAGTGRKRARRAARRRGRGAGRRAPRGPRRRSVGRRVAERGRRAPGRDHDLDLGSRPPDALAWPPRDAASCVRPPQPAHPRSRRPRSSARPGRRAGSS